MQALGGSARNGILSLTIRDKAVLYAAYMPFIKTAGYLSPLIKPTRWAMRYLCC